MAFLGFVYVAVMHSSQVGDLTAQRKESAYKRAERLERDKEERDIGHALLLHQLGQFVSMLFQHLHSGLHLALAAFLAALYLVAYLLHQGWVLIQKGEHHLALRRGHVFHLPPRVLLQEKALYGHAGSIANM